MIRALVGDVDPTTVTGDLSTRGHIFIAVATAVAMLFILRLLRRRQLAGKYALLWTVVAAFLGVLAVWPGLLTWVSEQVGVVYPPALFLLITTGFLFVVVIQFSYELSRLEDRSRTLDEEIALLRAERERDARHDARHDAGHDAGHDDEPRAASSPTPS
jgi:hypothetical protein